MVHLFSVKSRNVSMHCLARVTDGVYHLESINGHAAAAFPTMLLNKAQRHATARQSHSVPTLTNRASGCDVEPEVDYAAKLADLEW